MSRGSDASPMRRTSVRRRDDDRLRRGRSWTGEWSIPCLSPSKPSLVVVRQSYLAVSWRGRASDPRALARSCACLRVRRRPASMCGVAPCFTTTSDALQGSEGRERGFVSQNNNPCGPTCPPCPPSAALHLCARIRPDGVNPKSQQLVLEAKGDERASELKPS